MSLSQQAASQPTNHQADFLPTIQAYMAKFQTASSQHSADFLSTCYSIISVQHEELQILHKVIYGLSVGSAGDEEQGQQILAAAAKEYSEFKARVHNEAEQRKQNLAALRGASAGQA